jgi:hypothetical protein
MIAVVIMDCATEISETKLYFPTAEILIKEILNAR